MTPDELRNLAALDSKEVVRDALRQAADEIERLQSLDNEYVQKASGIAHENINRRIALESKLTRIREALSTADDREMPLCQTIEDILGEGEG